MKYFKTIHEKNSAKLTGLIAIILLLLLFVVGMNYLDPPEEYGIAVNFGTTDFGSGNRPLSQPKKAITNKVEESKPKESQPKPTETPIKTEEVLTQETEESIAIKKQKEAEARAKKEVERIEREKREAEERIKREQEEKKKNLDNLIGGVKNSNTKSNDGGEGPDSEAGNKGQLDGDPYAPSYFGGSGPGKGGVGYGLNGRGKPTKQIYKQDCNEFGLVVVRIEVNNQGKVISAEPGVRGTTNTHPCLLAPAKKIALSHKWPSDTNAPSRQVGFVSINFDVGQ